jgi:hypothetical protein
MQKIFALAALSLFIISCNSGIDNKNDVPAADYKISDTSRLLPPAVTTAAPVMDTAVKAKPVNQAKVEATGSSSNTVTTPVVLNNTSSKTAKGMNPAHGMPNHRCDIPVGAPLSTPVQKPGAQPVVQQPVQTVTSQPQPVITQSPVVTAPGMNPPHGQPGHDCSVEVGKPLKKAQ